MVSVTFSMILVRGDGTGKGRVVRKDTIHKHSACYPDMNRKN